MRDDQKPKSVDLEVLLWKYINHVGECEGTTFLSSWHADKRFTKDELSLLRELEERRRPKWCPA